MKNQIQRWQIPFIIPVKSFISKFSTKHFDFGTSNKLASSLFHMISWDGSLTTKLKKDLVSHAGKSFNSHCLFIFSRSFDLLMIQNSHLLTWKKSETKIPTTALQIFQKGHYRATVHGDVTHAPTEIFFLNFNSWKFYYSLGDSSSFNTNPYFELFYVPSTFRFHKHQWKSMLYIYQSRASLVPSSLESLDWRLWWPPPPKKKEEKKKNYDCPGKDVLPPNNFITKIWILFHSLSLYWCLWSGHKELYLAGKAFFISCYVASKPSQSPRTEPYSILDYICWSL